MGTLWIVLFLSFFVKGLINAQFVRKYRDVAFPLGFSGFLDNSPPFSFERHFDFTSNDPFFKSWWTPDINFPADFPPLAIQPRVQVFCDDSKLTLLIDKQFFGLRWTIKEMLLGTACYPNGELPNQYVFSYSFDQCGTTTTIENDRRILTNSLQLAQKTLPFLWQIPPSLHISCSPKSNPRFAKTPTDNGKRFNIQIMPPSRSNVAQPNSYKRGQMVEVQVRAKIMPGQQLFLHSCFVSASPEPQTRPRHAVILNKGCATSEGSPYPVVKFLESNRDDVVTISLNTSRLIPQLYIHCSVLVSDSGVTWGFKSCNYNVLQSRWEELGGGKDVCDCCSSKCKGLSSKNLPGSKVIVSSQLLVIEDGEQGESLLSKLRNVNNTLVSNPAQFGHADPTEDVIISSSGSFPSHHKGIVAIHQNPHSRKTFWLSGQGRGADHENGLDINFDKAAVQLQPSEDAPEQPSSVQQHSSLDLKDDPSLWDLNLLTMVDAWPIPHKADFAVLTERFKRNNQLGKLERNEKEVQVDFNTSAEINYLMLVGNQISPEFETIPTDQPQRMKWPSNEVDGIELDEKDFRQKDNLAGMQKDDVYEGEPIIRSKIQFSTGMDGFKMLSYEEEVKQLGTERDVGRKPEPRLKGLYSTFLNLLRRMDKAE